MTDQTEFHQPIESQADVIRHLEALIRQVPVLAPIAKIAGPLPLRRSEPGMASLVRIICGQQVSTRAAAAIFTRLEGVLGAIDAPSILDAGMDGLRMGGLSTPKCKTLLSLAEAVAQDEIDLHNLCHLKAEDAITSLVALKGIGPWTAEVYLLFAAGHPDIFPSGDLALQNAVQHAFKKRKRPDAKTLGTMAKKWSPHRGVASRLFWAYYAATTGRQGV